MEYSASVRSRMTIDRRGNRLDSMDVEVGGYRDNQALSAAVDGYNRGSEVADRWERMHEGMRPTGNPELTRKDWRYGLWWMLYAGMAGTLRRWRKRRL